VIPGRTIWITACVIAAVGALVFWSRPDVITWLKQLYNVVTDRDVIKSFVASFGDAAPLVFIGIQILQVIFAPIPGEATGFIGGYLFGASQGFIYSSIGLSVGSVINFGIGRLLGQRLVLKLIPQKQIDRLAVLTKPKGMLAISLMFVFPGFPKDYLCLFLGITDMPAKVVVLMATIGRMPGTLALSIQGASLLEKNYFVFWGLMGLFVILAGVSYRYRDKLYRWLERVDKKDPDY
jgi:uncharacterized membrane protein YdjX (TVP38/TMEM64 family)